MAIWKDTQGTVWDFVEGKLNFNDWVNEDLALRKEWSDAVTAYVIGATDTDADKIFKRWTDYANARVFSEYYAD